MRFVHVVGARPNFMKIAPVMEALRRHDNVEQVLVHTGQHYDPGMSQVFFDDLGIPAPDENLGIGSDTHGAQTGRMMVELESVFERVEPDCVVVVGDVNSTMAAALVAAKLGMSCAHIEAGLRSFDRTMPEEINRIVTDRIADLLLTHSPEADDNLLKEGALPSTIHLVGNVMIDTLHKHLDRAKERPVLADLGIEPQRYALVTLHRPTNVDDREVLAGLIDALDHIQQKLPVLLPLHPRTEKRLKEFDLLGQAQNMKGLKLAKPLGYLDFLGLLASAHFVLTDSGGLQEETTALGIPCLTLRRNTERPVTVTVGTNIVVGNDPGRVRAEAEKILEGRGKLGAVPELWDGRAGERAARVLVTHVKEIT